MQVNLQDITLAYPQQAPILSHLNCTIKDGKLIALLGPSGSGKTTLLNILSGLLTPTAGKVYFNDTDMTHASLQVRNIGMVFQDFALYPHLTVLDNIAFPLKLRHIKKRQRYQQARKLAALVHVDELLTKFPVQLSGGQQQRVAIARALIKQPAILLLDEPLSNLDANLRIELRNEIQHIQQTTQVTTIFVTHDQNDALQIADQIILLNQGTIQQVSSGTELYQHPKNEFVARFIGTPQINLLTRDDLIDNLTAPARPTIPAKTATVGIRSEALVLASTIPSPIQLPVTITKQKTIGREQLTSCRLGATTLTSTALPANLPVGSQVKLTVNPSEFLYFDKSGQALTGDNCDD
ncbi:ABC transporter ATP-binding protein [Lactiplantibacillus pentosus]|uniref:ABC transporter ATP-binding protein n=1 Tax=Lactiplantibacillus pentosus TaxID=1589 RepID=UPI000D01340E|nr:ABC transporter ATP-binding protein [Lactiplantibacillus pentosus]PRO83142.1 ABC transporter ATP-binding protein [Lactiplantibacillus pentosus]